MRYRAVKKADFSLRPGRAVLFLFVSACCVMGCAATGKTREQAQNSFLAQFRDPQVFSSAIASAAQKSVVPRKLSGITVPHHLVAADLIALAFQMTDASRIDTVIVLFPDHFKKSRSPFATTRRAFATVFGRLTVNQPDVEFLLQAGNLVEDSDLFGKDHGIGAILPFIKHYMPSVQIVPIAVSVGSRREDCDALATRLRRIVGPRTFIVQSTDFSHYLPLRDAVQRDQEVLNVLAADSLEAVARLRQSQHTDSRGAQYLQMRLQQDVFRARPLVLFNANSQAYLGQKVERTTSYIVQVYEPGPASPVGRDAPGSQVYCFGGDTFFGRGVLRALVDQGVAERVLREAQHVLNGCRLILNLTGVVVPELPVNLESLILAMPSSLTLQWLKALNVVAVSLANNHAMDLGSEPFNAMARMLSDAGIAVLKQGSVVDLGPFRLAAFTDLDNRTGRAAGAIENGDLTRLAASSAPPPLFAMVNWGTDYEAKPGPRQLALSSALRAAAVSLVVGVHPHLAAASFDLLDGGEGLSIYALGNFLFDQDSRVASGSILEVRMFDQGTYFARLVPHPNFFESAMKGGGSH